MKSRRPGGRSRPKGFTLVEILVVVGIVAILVALSSAALMFGLNKARSASCTANLQHLYSAVSQYASDNSGQLPVMLPLRSSVSDPGPTLDTALTAYLSDPAIFHCPADNTIFVQSGTSYLWVYGMSVNAQGQQNGTMVTPSFPLLQTTNPSQIPFISDKQSFHKDSPGTHVVYADGHVD